MNRFLAFFLISFLIHLAVGGVLLSRTGILGGKGTDETEVNDLENVDSLEETTIEDLEPALNPSPKTPLKITTEKKTTPKKAKKKIKPPSPPVKPKPAKKPAVKQKPQTEPSMEKTANEKSTPEKKNQKTQELKSPDKASTPPTKPVEEKKPEPADSEKTAPTKQTQQQPEPTETDTKEEWVDEEEVEEVPSDKKEKPTQAPQEGSPDKEKEKKQEPKEGTPSSSGKSDIPALEDSAARSHSQLRQLEGNPMPAYPKEARKKRWEGRVEVSYYVNSGGFVEKIQLKKSSGHSILDNSALRALARYRYYPGQEGWVKHPVEFFLETDKEIIETAPLGTRDPAKKSPEPQ